MSAWKKPKSGRSWCSMISAWRSPPPVAATQHGLTDQRVLTDEVEEVLEQTGERRPVDRTRDHEQVGGLDLDQGFFDVGGQVVAAQRAGERRAELGDFDQLRLDRRLRRRPRR